MTTSTLPDFDRSYTIVDKSAWERGPWGDEPDKVQWVDGETGLDCLINRGPGGALCGYVDVPSFHPWHGIRYNASISHVCTDACDETWCERSYEDRPEAKMRVHGGLTYSDRCQEGPESESICHVPLEGRTADIWWFGFDAAHGFDVVPKLPRFDFITDAVYRDLAYMVGECQSLARQLAEAIFDAAS